ncbi:hypothetical protein [Lactobacillus johnsonii]|uniref:hypothetical protein n=1 Tax=Lactobacillus johnsonii TaxID=33959 RepID=UPI0021A433D4|nr:hypothetical protein [Lactobacillus johnsonii]
MNVRNLSIKELQTLRTYLLVERMHARSAEAWQKYADMSDKVSKELQSRALKA